MPLIDFPDLPNVLGVPSIQRALGQSAAGLLTIANRNLGIPFNLFSGTWGIFKADGSLALKPDSIVAVGYRNGSRVSDYQLEAGAFESYNKVASPFESRVQMTISNDRAAFLVALDKLLKGLDIVAIVTPDATYPSVTLEGYDYRRDSRNGVSLLTIDLVFIEVRISVNPNGATFTKTKSASGLDALSFGQLTAALPSVSVQGALTAIGAKVGLGNVGLGLSSVASTFGIS